jgi:UDP-N-acetylmuramate dehydrogenase
MASDVKLRDISYYRTGGTCAALHTPASIEELAAVMRGVAERGRPFFLLGGGTNSLVLDEPYPGEVVTFGKLSRLEARGTTIVAGAGIENTAVAKLALQQGLAGAAWMNRLPGQLGGTVRMNARCYGGEISQIARKVTTVTRRGEVVVYEDPAMFRGYKDTIFMDNGEVVAEVELALRPGDPVAVEAEMRFCEDDRVKKGQFDFPSCGCVFKNDYAVGVSSGILLDTAGAKKLKHGGAEVSPHHANFVYNKGASSRDILQVTFAMRQLVYDKFGVWMEYEMEVLGALAPDLQARFDEQRPAQWDEGALAPLRATMRR